MTDVVEIASGMEMRSEDLVISSPNGRIAGVLNTMPGAPQDGPIILVPPTFGRAIQDYGVVAWTLAANGFRTVRYDQSNHLGASDGQMEDFKPSTAITDMHAVLDHIATFPSASSTAVVAFSLSFRFALRVLSTRSDVAMLLGIGSVVDMRATMAAALQSDYFAQFDDGTLGESEMALGHRIKSTFASDAVTNGLDTAETALADVERVRAAIVAIVNERDPWVAVADIRRVLADADRTAPTELVTVPAVAQHELQRNPLAAATALREMVAACYRHLGIGEKETVVPLLPQMARIQRAEAVAAQRRAARLTVPEEITTVAVS